MTISPRSPRGGSGRGGSNTPSSSGNSGSPSRTGQGSGAAPDPGAFGGFADDPPSESPTTTSSNRSPSYTGGLSGGSSGGSSGDSYNNPGGSTSSVSREGSNSGKNSNSAGDMRLSPGAIGGLVGAAVGLVFLASCMHYWSRGMRAVHLCHIHLHPSQHRRLGDFCFRAAADSKHRETALLREGCALPLRADTLEEHQGDHGHCVGRLALEEVHQAKRGRRTRISQGPV